MTKLPLIAVAALMATAGLAAPAFAATSTNAMGHANVGAPYCPTGNTPNYDKQMDALSIQLQLSTKQGSSIDVWGGCLKVTTIADGKSTTSFYDPDSLNLIATLS